MSAEPGMGPVELVADVKVFGRLSAQCDVIIDTTKRLPEFVFRHSLAKYFAVEYAHVYKQTFGVLLHEISDIFDDESVNYRMLDPQPWEGILSGLVSFAPPALAGRYAEVMSPKTGYCKILAGANLGVFWGSSSQWAIFADRISWELMVIATQKDIDVSGILGWPCFSAEQVKSYVTSQYHIKDPSDSIASNFNKRFFENYSL